MLRIYLIFSGPSGPPPSIFVDGNVQKARMQLEKMEIHVWTIVKILILIIQYFGPTIIEFVPNTGPE